MDSLTLSVHIRRPWMSVYEFLARPDNFGQWASGLGKRLRRVGDEWVAETDAGKLKVRFTKRNKFGVLDHFVIPQPGNEIYIPMRVIANGEGAELLFTLFRLPEMSDEKLHADAEWVRRDLAALKSLLEAQAENGNAEA